MTPQQKLECTFADRNLLIHLNLRVIQIYKLFQRDLKLIKI